MVTTLAPAEPPVLQAFPAIDLYDLDAVALLDRRDTKYVANEDTALRLLEHLCTNYAVLEVDGRREHGYRTVYFDTEDLSLYHAHRRGQSGRFKVRSRLYVESNRSFLEVKKKGKRDRTIKVRQGTDEQVTQITATEAAFIREHSRYRTDGLAPQLINSFRRVTLVSIERCERVTLDFGLAFEANGFRAELPGTVIIEVKEAAHAVVSPIRLELRRAGIRPGSFSKYCVGVCLLFEEVRHNRFLPVLRQLTVQTVGGPHVA